MKFNYTLTLNIILFCIFKFFIVIDLCLNNVFYHIFTMLSFTKKHKGEYLSRMAKFNRYNIAKAYDYEGKNICYANTFFGAFYCGYSYFFIGSIFGTLVRLFGEFHGIVVYLIPIIPIAVWWYPAQRAVFYKDRYLKYFKQFEKKDNAYSGEYHPVVPAITTQFLSMSSPFALGLCKVNDYFL